MVAVSTIGRARPEREEAGSPRHGAAPRADLAWVPRPALLEVLSQALRRRLTTVIAGPGCGKTTLLASWARTVPGVWYSVGSADADLPVLIQGLVEAVGVQWPEHYDDACVDTVAGALAAAVHSASSTDFALIIDDVQDLPPEGSSARLLASLCRQAPPMLHLVLSSRTQLPFSVQRLLGRGEVLELDAAGLALSVTDTETLLASVYRGRLPPGALRPLAERVHELTGGWPAATRLTAEWLKDRESGTREELAALSRPGGLLFGYVAEEVLDPSDARVRALLTEVAPLPCFTVELCQALGVDVGEIELTRFARERLFVRPYPDRPGWFTLGPLVCDVALARMHPDTRQRVRSQAMTWFTGYGHLGDALSCALELDEPQRTARFLLEHGAELLARGGVTGVLAAASELPALLRTEVIEQLEGHARLVRGDWRGARQCLLRAAREAPLAPALAWALCWSHYLRGEFDEAVALADQIPPDGEPTAAQALLLSWAARASWRRGDRNRSRPLAERALTVATASGDDHAVAAAHTAMLLACAADGDHGGAQAHATMGLAAARSASDLLRMIPILVYRAVDHLEQGAYQDALHDVEVAIRHAEHVDYPAALAFALGTRGRARLGLGRLDEAIADFDASRTLYQRIGTQDVVFSLLGLADAYRERGELALASSAYTEALTWAERHDDDRVLVPALSGLARVLAGEDPRRATMLAARATESAQGGGRLIALLAVGWVALEAGGSEQALRWAVCAVEAAGARSDRAALAEALELRAAASPDATVRLSSMREAASVWADIGNPVAAARNAVVRARMAGAGESEVAETERRLCALGVREPSAPAAGLLRAVPAPMRSWVRVRTLGGFAVLRDGVPVCMTEWNSKKARDLLKLLISRHGRPTAREVLIEMLWPGKDPARCANRLSVALSAIRTVLDPEHRHPPDHFVHSDNHVVRLANLRVDVEEFLTAAIRVTDSSLGVPALDELRVVERLYTGDFLPEDPYEDWTVSLREQARHAYLAVARALAVAAAAAGDDDLAVRFFLRILEFDRYDEDAHLRLIATLTSAGRHGQARASYRTYQNRMAELGITVARTGVT